MAKNGKTSGITTEKTTRDLVSNTSQPGNKSLRPTSKRYKGDKPTYLPVKDGKMPANMFGESDHAGYHDNASVILEKADRPEWQMTAVEKMDMAREGVSKKKLENFKSKTHLDYDKLSVILSTTRATLINKKGTEHFSAALSERIVSIADLYSFGFKVFEDETKFRKWIFRPNQALGGKPPFELLDNQFGREEVKNLIGRIDYGVYS